MERTQRISKGSVETLVVELYDRLDEVTDLAANNPRYTVIEVSTGDTKYTDQAATTDIMNVLCQIDTTTWTEGDYDLFVRLTIGSDTPYLYAGRFRVD